MMSCEQKRATWLQHYNTHTQKIFGCGDEMNSIRAICGGFPGPPKRGRYSKILAIGTDPKGAPDLWKHPNMSEIRWENRMSSALAATSPRTLGQQLAARSQLEAQKIL